MTFLAAIFTVSVAAKLKDLRQSQRKHAGF
jgi:hypothetical protein